MSHRGEKQSDPCFVRPDMFRLFSNFCHPHHVAGGIKAIKRSTRVVELIAEHEHEMTGHGVLAYECGGLARRRSNSSVSSQPMQASVIDCP